jgi:tetratricopeptide (TPR) repeat protein
MMHARFQKPTIIIVLLFIWGTTTTSWGQTNPGMIKYQLAQNYERGGDFETAVKLYREAYASDSTNPVYLDALKRCYLQLKQYDQTISLLQHWVERNPSDLNLLSQLGSVYALKSDDSAATAVWARAAAIAPDKEITYRIVGNTMIQSRLFDRAIDLFKQGRIACNNSLLFGDDVARLYGIMMNYSDATKEYVSILRQSPAQLGYIQTSIAQYTGRADGLSAATSVVEESIKSEPTNVLFYQLLAWLYMEGKQYEHAYTVYKTLDEMMHAGGRELFNFAERALREKSFAVARLAYKDILRMYQGFSSLPQAKFGYARALEESVTIPDTVMTEAVTRQSVRIRPEDTSRFDSVLTAYHQIITDHPTTEFAARALLRIAFIKRDYFFNLESARSALESVITTYARFRPLVIDAEFQLGDIYISSGDLTTAKRKFKLLADDANIDHTQRERAIFRLAEIDYFGNEFQKCLEQLALLTRNSGSDLSNDALDLKLFIQENLTPSDSSLQEYAHAEFIKRQHRYPEALAELNLIIIQHPKSTLADNALLGIGNILTIMGRYDDAVTAYARIEIEYQESIFLDRALMQIGLLYQFGTHKYEKAIATYQQLLEKYPGSMLTNEARKHIRELRGDAL